MVRISDRSERRGLLLLLLLLQLQSNGRLRLRLRLDSTVPPPGAVRCAPCKHPCEHTRVKESQEEDNACGQVQRRVAVPLE